MEGSVGEPFAGSRTQPQPYLGTRSSLCTCVDMPQPWLNRRRSSQGSQRAFLVHVEF